MLTITAHQVNLPPIVRSQLIFKALKNIRNRAVNLKLIGNFMRQTRSGYAQKLNIGSWNKVTRPYS